jgi:hypothetical protein
MYIVFVIDYDSAAPKSTPYCSGIQLLKPGATATKGMRFPKTDPLFFAEKATNSLFPDTWNHRAIIAAIKEAYVDAYVQDQHNGTIFIGTGNGIRIEGKVYKPTGRTAYISTAYPI